MDREAASRRAARIRAKQGWERVEEPEEELEHPLRLVSSERA
jgi:hypothetical protein